MLGVVEKKTFQGFLKKSLIALAVSESHQRDSCVDGSLFIKENLMCKMLDITSNLKIQLSHECIECLSH